MELNFEVDNVFAAEYETIAYYPLPGRTYNLRLLFQIKPDER
jgi:outer membrane cobalamin receptor